tara:strand:+ start:1360 stop:1965 length:606 start_codon:yes stop_codon:yes gene_type:complete
MAITINGSSNTITGLAVGGLPDGVVDTDMLAANAVTVAKASGSVKGITMSELWRINTSFSISAGFGDIDSNWEVADHYTSGSIGSSMTQSSGIFTFPSPGVYLIQFILGFYKSGVSRRYLGAGIEVTSDNSSYSQAAINYASIANNTASTHQTAITNAIFDVTNTSTHKCKFYIANVDTISIHGHTDANFSSAMFTRLGDS